MSTDDEPSGAESTFGGVPEMAHQPVETSVVNDVDGYSAAVKGIHPLVVRTGQGRGPNVVQTAQIGHIVATSAAIGFPMLSRTIVGDGDLAAVVVTSTPDEGGRWCEIDLRPGMVLVYGPGAEHAGIDPVGFGFTFAIPQADELESLADELELNFVPPARGHVHALVPSQATSDLGDTLLGLFDGTAGGIADPQRRQDDILHATVRALSVDRRERRVGGGRRIDSRHVTQICIEYAETIGRAPTSRELCLVAHVSGRRLRSAFDETYGMPPSLFFRNWALGLVRRRLKSLDPRSATVTDVALGHGFAHLGRFSSRYRQLYGESPSATLRSSSSR